MSVRRPLAVDLFCGLGGWSSALMAEGWHCVGFDIERHRYPARYLPSNDTKNSGGSWFAIANNTTSGHKRNPDGRNGLPPLTGGWMEYPGSLVIQDVLTLHGSQFRDASLIVASPPCQKYSYMAMPWTRAKAKAAAIRADTTGAELERLNRLFSACFRIQREASEAAGRHIPMVVENVRGAIPWVGRSRWNFGSFHLWGDVPALMPITVRAQKFNPDGTNHGQGSWFAIADSKQRGVLKGAGPAWDAAKGCGAHGMTRWTNPAEGAASFASKFPARKAASAMIAKIPESLARWIARAFLPPVDLDEAAD